MMKLTAIITADGLTLGKSYEAMAVGAGSNYGYQFLVFNDHGKWTAYNLFTFIPYDAVELVDLRPRRVK